MVENSGRILAVGRWHCTPPPLPSKFPRAKEPGLESPAHKWQRSGPCAPASRLRAFWPSLPTSSHQASSGPKKLCKGPREGEAAGPPRAGGGAESRTSRAKPALLPSLPSRRPPPRFLPPTPPPCYLRRPRQCCPAGLPRAPLRHRPHLHLGRPGRQAVSGRRVVPPCPGGRSGGVPGLAVPTCFHGTFSTVPGGRKPAFPREASQVMPDPRAWLLKRAGT